MGEGGIPLSQWNGSDATKQLEETLKRISRITRSSKRRCFGGRRLAGFTFLAVVVSLVALVVSLHHG
jgi:hypothetical protein